MRVTVDLRFGYKIHILAPDEGQTARDIRERKDVPVWRLLIDGTPDPRDAETGFSYSGGLSYFSLKSQIQSTLHHNVSSSVVDEFRPLIEEEIKKIYDEYHAQNPSTNPQS